eukprot:jgi/Botrbrau1/17973/Bobra.50_1s0062.1
MCVVGFFKVWVCTCGCVCIQMLLRVLHHGFPLCKTVWTWDLSLCLFPLLSSRMISPAHVRAAPGFIEAICSLATDVMCASMC